MTTPTTTPAGTFTMADTLRGSLGSLPPNLKAYASYVDNYGGYDELVSSKLSTGALLVSITIFGNRARCADFEPGGMANSQAPGWLDNVAEPDPWLYTYASNASALYVAAGNRRYVRWQAHTGQGPHICGTPGRIYDGNPGCQYPDADVTQWVFNPGGVNIDLSIGDARLLPPPPPPPDPHGYERLIHTPFRNTPFGDLIERDVVLHYDGARQHPLRYRRLLAGDLRPKLHWLADRLFAVAHAEHNPDGSPSWQKFDRGWRYQQLRHRADGLKIA